MSVKFKEMVAAQTLTAVATTYYTAPGLTSASIQAATAYNSTGAAVDLQIFKVPAAGSANNATLICRRSVPAGTTIQALETINHKLEPGTQIFALGLALTLNISGVEYVQE